ncbi:MAG: MBL fold metallo-hydrolase [Bacteroidia bacterium]|jgi:phosphoribosyl 1,2-cyclic phosphate phosphodiesterase|nr:MBL fold metallo-hydrolase [Bacteroidia bacterium]
MQITFLGTGTSQGVPLIACSCSVCSSADLRDKRLRTSIAVVSNGAYWVVDSGPDFRQQMLTHQVPQLDGLLFTHAHKDHIAGMDDIRGFNFKMKKPIDVYCTEQVELQMRQEFHYIFSEHKYPGIPDISLHRLHANTQLQHNRLSIQCIEVMHYKLPVLGFRFSEGVAANDLVYITDANYISPQEKEKIKGCGTLVVNALRREQHISHFSLQEAIELVNEIKPKQAYFTHISHQLGLHAEVEPSLPQGMHLAYDGLTLTL